MTPAVRRPAVGQERPLCELYSSCREELLPWTQAHLTIRSSRARFAASTLRQRIAHHSAALAHRALELQTTLVERHKALDPMGPVGLARTNIF